MYVLRLLLGIQQQMKMLDQYPTYAYLFSLFLVTVFLFKWLTLKKTTLKNPPPSPPRLPMIGNLHQIGPDLHLSLRSLAQKYGPLMQLKFGNVPVLVVSSADAAREIMKTHDLAFSDRPISSISNKLFYNSKDMTFCRYTEYWKQLKSICVTQLLSSSRVSSYYRVREEEVARLIQNIQCSDSKIVNLSALLAETANNVISRCALGRNYEGLNKGNAFKKLHDDVAMLLGSGRSTGDLFPLLFWVDWLKGLKGKVEKAAKEADDFLEDVLRDHQSTSASSNGYAAKDFLSILLEIQNTNAGSAIDSESVKALILNMFLGGTGTTSTTTVWTMAALVKNPDAMVKLQKEVREIGKGKPLILESDLVNMHYLEAVMKESLRMNMPAPLLLPREARQDVKVMGYDVRSGTQVLINAWAIARDPSLWDNPDEFQPQRFLNSQIDYKGHHFEYLPFGGGRRLCPGIKFGVALHELAVANLVHKFDFELPDGEKKEDLDMTGATGLTVGRKSPLLVIATPHV